MNMHGEIRTGIILFFVNSLSIRKENNTKNTKFGKNVQKAILWEKNNMDLQLDVIENCDSSAKMVIVN